MRVASSIELPRTEHAALRVAPTALLRLLARFLLLPSALYLGIFWALTYPLLGSFSTAFFADAGDGLQNVWNIWWINYAVTVLHTSPWYTNYLHYPAGVSLISHTFNPFNGFVSVLLLRFETLVQAHNTMVVFSFVLGGVGASWLSYVVARSYWASLIGGAIFTFSQYHFAHAEGHLQLVSLEWLPIFAVLWYLTLKNPSPALAIGSALALLLVILCDYYYFFYSVLLAVVLTGFEAWRRRDVVFMVRTPHLRPLLLFAVLAAGTSGIMIVSLLRLNAGTDPLIGAHEAEQFSTDLLAAIIPGGHWRFAPLTRPFWGALPGNIHESSVAIGVAVLAALGYLIVHRSHPVVRATGPWWVLLFGFWLLSLGPVLHVWGRPFVGIPMPYTVLAKLIPPLSLSGAPVRMMVMVTLAAAVLASVGFALLLRGSARTRVLACSLLVLLTIEYLPGRIPALRPPPAPGYITALQQTPAGGGVFDLVSGYSSTNRFGQSIGTSLALYYQTIFERPMAIGYVARVSQSSIERLHDLERLLEQGSWETLCRSYDLRYVILPSDGSSGTPPESARLVYADEAAHADLLDLAPGGRCISNE